MEEEIQSLEERLRKAQLSSDVKALGELISNELQFVLHDGSVISKADDLKAHENRLVIFNRIDFSEQRILCFGNVASVTVKADVVLEMDGDQSKLNLRYGRTWVKFDEGWQIIAGSVTSI